VNLQAWQIAYPMLTDLRASEMSCLQNGLHCMDVPAQQRLFAPGQACKGFPLLLSGRIKVSRSSESGREIVLYRVEPGESCIVSAACLGSHQPYNAEAITETACTLGILDTKAFDTLMCQHPPFREFVFGLFMGRMGSLVQLIDEVAFQRLDLRLARTLLQLMGDDGTVARSHQQLADELGSVREMVSRVLKHFEHAGAVQLGRQQIRVVNTQCLQRLASQG